MTDYKIQPTNYNITLTPDLESFIFKGNEVVTFQVKESIDKILLDVLNLEIFSCKLLVENKKEDLQFFLDKEQGQLVIQLHNTFENRELQVEIEFKGELNDKLAGFYRSKYMENGKEKYLATTQFEAADARQAFPCIDAPLYKATFDITLIVDKKYIAISNMPELKVEDIGTQKKAVTFQTSPKMSTYLVYFGVGEFEIQEDKYKDILLRAITTSGKKQATHFALESTKKSLQYFENYFNVKYPLPKLDLIAIPDFASGAMENWGAITFRETALLYYPDKSSLATSQRVAEVVAHELAHQWFGNLVTMKWWDDLWLNESFATYMAYKVLDHYWPEWNIWTEYLMDTVFDGMSADSLHDSHPIKVEVKSVHEMDELFDEIAYYKGGSILRMVEIFLGEELFREGLREYIKTHAYKNTEAHDLWSSLEKAAKKPMTELIEKYIIQTGFPYLTITQKKDSIFLQQSRFLFKDALHKEKWWIPLNIKIKDDKDHDNVDLYIMKDKTLELPSLQNRLISINEEYGGFYISSYDESLLEKIGGYFPRLSEQEKIGVVHDLYYLSLYQKQSPDIFFNFISKYVKKVSSGVLLYLIDVLDKMYLLKESVVIKEHLHFFAKQGLTQVGLEARATDSTYDVFLRSATLQILSMLEDKKVGSFLDKKFLDYLNDPSLVHPDIRLVVYSHAVWRKEENYQKIMKMYKNTEIQEEKVKMLSALMKSKNPKMLQETLAFALTPHVRMANVMYILQGGVQNPYARLLTLDWTISTWPEFKKRVSGHGGVILARFAKIVVPTGGVGNEDEVKKFLKSGREQGVERTFDQVWESLVINSEFAKLL